MVKQGGMQYFPPSFASSSQICHHRGYPACFPKISELENEWYSQQLIAASEPSLFESAAVLEDAPDMTIRFTWLRSFHPTVIIRVSKSGDGFHFIAKKLSGTTGYEPGTIESEISRNLTKNEKEKLLELFDSNQVFQQQSTLCTAGFDGAQWIFEKSDKVGYQFVNRWSPDAGPVREVGLSLLNLTDWKFEEIY